jgi:heptosyltransferase-1
MHLAAALRVPVVGVFCDSEPLDAQPLGTGRTAHRGGIGLPPSAKEVLAALGEVAPLLR